MKNHLSWPRLLIKNTVVNDFELETFAFQSSDHLMLEYNEIIS